MENMEIKLNESELIANLVEAKSKAELWDITGVEWVKLYESLSASCYEYLNLVKNKNQKTALVFTDSSDIMETMVKKLEETGHLVIQ